MCTVRAAVGIVEESAAALHTCIVQGAAVYNNENEGHLQRQRSKMPSATVDSHVEEAACEMSDTSLLMELLVAVYAAALMPPQLEDTPE